MNLLALALLQSFSLVAPVAPPAISVGMRAAVVEVVIAPTLSAETQLGNAPSLALTAAEYPSAWPRAFETRATGKYYGARYYGSKMGRFTTIDPVYTWEENLVDPQRWNRYAYARNNPLKYTDPNGKWIVPAALALWGAVEFGLQLYDGYSTVQTLSDPNASFRDKAISGGGFVLGAIAPGGGYGAGGKAVAGKADDLAKKLAKEGRYEFPDQTVGGIPYVGQSGNIPKRLGKHERDGRLVPGSESSTQVLGGKTAREIAEHRRIQELTGGVSASKSGQVANKVDPIGPNRRSLLDEKK